ncbi:amidohydrolase [Candidatus Hodarchaeum mangrovi]
MTKEYYDWVLFGDHIQTMDSINPSVEMIAVKNDKFVYVGSHKEKFLKNTTNFTNLAEKAIIPGFIDLHTHLWKDSGILSVDLSNILTYRKTLDKIEEEISKKKPGEWLFASNWDESKWLDSKKYIQKVDLDIIAPKNPVYAKREDGHLVVVNSLAFKALNLDLNHPGVDKDSTRIPSGILKDVWIDMTPFYQNLIPNSIEKAASFAASKGITSVVDNLTITPEGQKNILKAYFTLDTGKKLGIRIFLNPTRNSLKQFHAIGMTQNWGSSYLRFSGFKGFYDGALGAYTALLSSRYEDIDTNGEIFLNDDELVAQIKFAEENEYTICIHAIGDQAIERLLNCYEKALKGLGKTFTERRHRIEHAECISNPQIQKAKELGIILSMQPNFLKWQYPGQLYEQRLGKDRFLKLNRFNTILTHKAHLCFGSDNMPLDPLFGIREALIFPSHEVQIPLMEAVKAYTINNAHALFMESLLGSITKNKYADFVILKKPLNSIDPEKINSNLIDSTVVGGSIIYQSE